MKRDHTTRNSEHGFALVGVMLLTMTLAGLAALVMLRVQSDFRATEQYTNIIKAEEAADAGLEYAIGQSYGLYASRLRGGQVGSLADIKDFLGGIVSDGATVDLLKRATPLDNGAEVLSLTITRADSGPQIVLTIRSVGSAGGRERTAVQRIELTGDLFQGFDYAVLTEETRCILCHAEIDNVFRNENTDSDLFGSFERVKMGALGDLSVRANQTQSNIAGTVHARGEVDGDWWRKFYDIDNDEENPLANSTFKAYEFDKTKSLIEDETGSMIPVALNVPTVTDLIDADSESAEPNLRINYGVDESMDDGELPEAIPPIIPDTNNNRQVDPEEWKEEMSQLERGSIRGGTAYGLPEGKVYDSRSLPESSNEAIKYLASTGHYDGNVILLGTDRNPIEIDGTVAVNGDVLIKGAIKGTGSIISKGNIYFAGDTTYADGKEYGVAEDGTKNAVSYAAAGNILVGDYLTPMYTQYDRLTHTSDKAYGYFMVDDSTKGIPSYVSNEAIDSGPALDKGHYTSNTGSAMMNFNKREYEAAQQDPSYQPRYYKMNDDAPVYRLDPSAYGDYAKAIEYTTSYASTLVAEIGEKELDKATVLTMSPDQGWIPDLLLKLLWQKDDLSRPENGDEQFRIDGMLYTNNALMAHMRSYTRHHSRTNGAIRIRGSVLASDLGMMAAGDYSKNNYRGTKIYYDDRVRNLLDVADAASLEMVRSIRLFEMPGQTL